MKLSEQLEAVLAMRRQQREEGAGLAEAGAGGGGQDDASSTGGSEASFKTALEGTTSTAGGATGGPPPGLRLYTPSGGSRSPSIPSTASFAGAVPPARPTAQVTPPPSLPHSSAAPVAVPHPAAPPPAAPASLMERLKAQRAERMAAAQHAGGTEVPQAAGPAPLPSSSVLPPFPAAAPPPSPQPTNLSSPRSPPRRPPRQRTSEYVHVSPKNAPAGAGGWGEDVGESGWEGGGGWTDWGGQDGFPLPEGFSPFPQEPLSADRQHPQPADLAGFSSFSAHAQHPGHEPALFDPENPNSPFNPSPLTFPHLDNFSPFEPHPHLPPEQLPSRASDRTVLNEAAPMAPRASSSSSPVHHTPSPRDQAERSGSHRSSHSSRSMERDLWALRAERERRDRQKKLDWERREREKMREVQGAASPAPSTATSRSGSRTLVVNASPEQHAAVPETREKGGRSGRSGSSKRDRNLAEGWLLLPPPASSSSPSDLLDHPDFWHPQYALLSARELRTVAHDGETPPWRACRVSEIRGVRRLAEHDQPGFEPFVVDLTDGSQLLFAGKRGADTAYWTLALDPCLDPSTPASTPPTAPPDDVYDRHLAKLEQLVANYDRDAERFAADIKSPSKRSRRKKPCEGSERMRRSNKDVPAFAFVEELPPDAADDDWGTSLHEARQPPGPDPLPPAPPPDPRPVSQRPWPVRPPPEEPRPSQPYSEAHHLSADPSYLRPSDAFALQTLLDQLTHHSAAVDAKLAQRKAGIQIADRELERLREEVLLRADAEGRVSEADGALLDQIEWLLTVNNMRLKKHHRGASVDSAASSLRAAQGGGVPPPSMQEEELVRVIQQRIDAMLRASGEAERRADVEEEWRREEEGRRDSMITYEEEPYPTSALPAETPVTHYYHPSGAVFSPAPPQPHLATAGEKTRTAAQTPAVTSKFSPNTSEHHRPTQNHGVPGEPLPPPPATAAPHPSYDQPYYPHHPSMPSWPEAGEWNGEPLTTAEDEWYAREEQERWDKERYLQEVRLLFFSFLILTSGPDDQTSEEIFLDIEAKFHWQQKFISATTSQQARLSRQLQKLLHHLKSDSTSRSTSFAALLHAINALSTSLDTLPSSLVAATGPLHPPQPPPYPSQGGPITGDGAIPRTEMRWLAGDGRMGKRLVPAKDVPRGSPSGGLGAQQGLTVFGLPDPVNPAHHTSRWTTGVAGAKAAKELDALVAHAEPATGGKKMAKKGKGKEHPVVEEIAQNPVVQRELRELEGRRLVEGKKEEEGDPATKAFAIYEILQATREAAAKEKREKNAVAKGRPKAFGLSRPAPLPASAALPARDDFPILLSRLLTSSEPPEKILAGLAALLAAGKTKSRDAPPGYVGEGEMRSRLKGLLVGEGGKRVMDAAAQAEQELAALSTRKAELQQKIGEDLKKKAAADL
ncbi:hypothetical protein JCM10213v2_006057 [Rhodosporidiobolus nylandii]